MDILKIRDECIQIGVCDDEGDFCSLMGRAPSYLSDSISRDRSISLHSILSLTLNLSVIKKNTQDAAGRESDPVTSAALRNGIATIESIDQELWSAVWEIVST